MNKRCIILKKKTISEDKKKNWMILKQTFHVWKDFLKAYPKI